MSTVIEQIENGHARMTSASYPQALHDVIEVLGHGRDHLASVDTDDDAREVRIRVEWSVRCCDQSENYDIPYDVLEADDPKKAARRWIKTGEIKQAETYFLEKEGEVEYARKRLAKLNKELGELS